MNTFPETTGFPAVELAKKIATEAHKGQTRWGGEPYIVHPEAVALEVSSSVWQVRAGAWLHDVVEDTALTLGDLLDNGVPTEVLHIVRLLTHRPEDSYLDYLLAIKRDHYASLVKRADLRCNLRDSEGMKNKNSIRDKWMLALWILAEERYAPTTP
jgi:(p)ppGpp synthase/HD superfamily hydrolase